MRVLLAVTGAILGCSSGSDSVKRLFITSTTSAGGDVGGLAGADQKCQNAADSATAAGLGSFAGATWKAWLSDSQTKAIDRIADVGPWFKVDEETKIANNKAQLALVPPQLLAGGFSNERGGPGAEFYWTGTSAGGHVSPVGTCQDWTANVGCTAAGGSQSSSDSWTDTRQ